MRNETRFCKKFDVFIHSYRTNIFPSPRRRITSGVSRKGASMQRIPRWTYKSDLNTRTRSGVLDAPRIACTLGFYTSLLRSQSRSRINPERIFPYRTTKDTNSFNSTRRSNRSIDLYSTKLRRKNRRKFDITSKANLNYTFLDYTKKVARNGIIVVKFSQRMYRIRIISPINHRLPFQN